METSVLTPSQQASHLRVPLTSLPGVGWGVVCSANSYQGVKAHRELPFSVQNWPQYQNWPCLGQLETTAEVARPLKLM